MHSPRFEGLTPLYELPALIEPLDAARGTILALDWRALRELALFQVYHAAIQRDQRDALLSVIAGSWVPLPLMLEHYRALDSLHLDTERIHQVGMTVGNRAHGAFLLTLIRLAGSLGLSAWAALEQSHKLWVRSWRGGDIAVHRLAPKVAQVSLLETGGLCGSRFFCISFSGALCAGIGPFCKAPVAQEISGSRTSCTIAYRLSWS